MAQWCFDPLASAMTGSVQFKRPYPADNWRKEKDNNEFLLTAMRVCMEADKIFRKDTAKWDDGDDKFYRWMIAGIDEELD